MSKKHSLASKARWASISAADRKQMMSDLARKRMAKLTPKQRRNIAMKLVKARKANV